MARSPNGQKHTTWKGGKGNVSQEEWQGGPGQWLHRFAKFRVASCACCAIPRIARWLGCDGHTATQARKTGSCGSLCGPAGVHRPAQPFLTAARWTHECVVEVGHGFERRNNGVEHRVAWAKVLCGCHLKIINL